MKRKTVILIWVCLIWFAGCVTVRIITGDDNQYEGNQKSNETKGIEVNEVDSVGVFH